MYNISSVNATDIATVYSQISSIAPWLFPLFLFFEFSVIFLGGMYGQNRKIGYSNVAMWGTLSGMVTTTSAFFLSAISGILNIATISVCLGVTFLFALWYFLSDLGE